MSRRLINLHRISRDILQLLIATQGCQWEMVSILVVVNEKMAGEAGTCELRFRPTPISILLADQIINSSLNGIGLKISRSHQSEQRPGCLGRGAGALTAKSGLFVRSTGLAPAAINILCATQPRRSLFNLSAFHIEGKVWSNRPQPDER